MYFDGSWTMASFTDMKFDWSVFAPPPPKGKKGSVTFHPDSGTRHEPGDQVSSRMQGLPPVALFGSGGRSRLEHDPDGFFPIASNAAKITDAHANAFLQMTKARPTDVRFVWPKLMSGKPSGYNLLQDGTIAVMTGKKRPQDAADDLQNGLAQWYAPAAAK